MSHRIWKYELEVVDRQQIKMPSRARLLAVGVEPGGTHGVEYGQAVLWVLCEPTRTFSQRTIAIVGTGHVMEEVGKYVGTFRFDGVGFVGHVFDEGEVVLEGDEEGLPVA